MQNTVYAGWRHVFKLDPDKALEDAALDAVCLSGTDAVLVGGSSGVNFDNTVELLSRIRRYEVPCALEVTSAESAVPGFDQYFIPLVLNTQAGEWITGRQADALVDYGAFMPWEQTAAEGYIILNAGAEAALLTGANTELSESQTLAYGKLADRLMRLPVVYLEYSGRFGDMPLIHRVRKALTQARLFYGGGINNGEKARLAAEAAHTIVVGNVIYDCLDAALETVAAVKAVPVP